MGLDACHNEFIQISSEIRMYTPIEVVGTWPVNVPHLLVSEVIC